MLRFKVKGDKRFLVIARVGDSSLHREWLKPSQYKNFDLCLSYFGSEPKRFAEDCDFYHATPGVKWPKLQEIVDAFGEGLSHYDAIWLPDDDISTNAYDINRMFELFMQHQLQLAQPALTKDSYFSHKITLVNPNYALRYCNFVEPMVPIYSRDAFQLLLPSFAKSEAAYGLDFVWPKILGYPHRQIAIIDDVTVKHTRPVGGGTLYQNISRNRWDDFHRVTKEYKAKVDWNQTHYDGIPKGKKVMFALFADGDEQVLAAQLDNIRHFNPNAGIVVYNGSTNKALAKHLDALVCPYSRPLHSKNTALFQWDVMTWLDEHKVDYEYLINLDSEMLFIKKGFQAYLDRTMNGYDCMGWGLQEIMSFEDADSAEQVEMWNQLQQWESILPTDGLLHCLSTAQVYRRKTVERMLSSVDRNEVRQKLAAKSEKNGLQQFFFVTLASSIGARYREYPWDLVLDVMRYNNEISLEEAQQAVHHPYYYFLHPMKKERLIGISHWLLNGNKLKEAGAQRKRVQGKLDRKAPANRNTVPVKTQKAAPGADQRLSKNRAMGRQGQAIVTNKGQKPAPALVMTPQRAARTGAGTNVRSPASSKLTKKVAKQKSRLRGL